MTNRWGINTGLPYPVPKFDIEIAELRQRTRNVEELLDNIMEKDYQLKITNFCERFGLDTDKVMQKILDDQIFALVFAKDPGKQTFHQNYAANYIRGLPFIIDLVVLPSSGKNAQYVINGEVKSRVEVQNTKVKSIDFTWNYEFKEKVLKFYATHKYTRGQGGAQDNQLEDVFKFLENARQCVNKNIFFFAITDGNYYTVPYTKDTGFPDNKDRIEYMNAKYQGNRLKVTKSENILTDIITVLEKWLVSNFSLDEISEEIKLLEHIKTGISL